VLAGASAQLAASRAPAATPGSARSSGSGSKSSASILTALPLPAFDQPHISTEILQQQREQEAAEGRPPLVPPLPGIRSPSPPSAAMRRHGPGGNDSAGQQPRVTARQLAHLRSPVARQLLQQGAYDSCTAAAALQGLALSTSKDAASSQRQQHMAVPKSPSPPPLRLASASPRVAHISTAAHAQPCPPPTSAVHAARSPGVAGRAPLHVATGVAAGALGGAAQLQAPGSAAASMSGCLTPSYEDASVAAS
jgi:hypothetical protein